LALDVVLGYAGVITLGHAVYFGVGAYSAALLAQAGWHEPITGVLASGAISAAIALVCAPFITRFTGLPLVMMTIAVNAIVYEAANQATFITGGDDGLTSFSFDPVFGLFKWDLSGQTQYVYALAWLLLCFILVSCIVRSPFGLSLKGIRENPQRMKLVGAPVLRQLTLAYTISGLIAGVAGAVSSQTTGFASLGGLSPEASISILVMLAIGGIGNLYGAFIGVPLFLIVRHTASTWNPYHWLFVMGVLLIAVRFSNGGLLGLFKFRPGDRHGDR
jgi:branched-chain amino acid transport system permease protein